MSATAPGEKAFLLAHLEAPLPRWLARRVPARLVADLVTVMAGGLAVRAAKVLRKLAAAEAAQA